MANAWLEGKVFTALMIERMVRAAESLFPGAMPWQPRRSRWREIEFLYRQVGAALLPCPIVFWPLCCASGN